MPGGAIVPPRSDSLPGSAVSNLATATILAKLEEERADLKEMMKVLMSIVKPSEGGKTGSGLPR